MPLAKNELVVLEQRAFVIEAIAFEQRLESVEWWEPSPVSRDYYRLWLASTTPSRSSASPSREGSREGLEVLVYRNRDDGKKYIQALYD